MADFLRSFAGTFNPAFQQSGRSASYLRQRQKELTAEEERREEEARQEELARRQQLRMSLAEAGVNPATIDRYVPAESEAPVEYQSIGKLLGIKGRQAEAAKQQTSLIDRAKEAREEEEQRQRQRGEKFEDWVKKEEWKRRHPKETKPTEEEKQTNKLMSVWEERIRKYAMDNPAVDLMAAFKAHTKVLPSSFVEPIAQHLGLDGDFLPVATPEGKDTWMQSPPAVTTAQPTFYGATSLAEVEAAVATVSEPERSRILEEARRFFDSQQVSQGTYQGRQEGTFQPSQQAR